MHLKMEFIHTIFFKHKHLAFSPKTAGAYKMQTEDADSIFFFYLCRRSLYGVT